MKALDLNNKTIAIIKYMIIALILIFSTNGFSQKVETTTTNSLINTNVEIVISNQVALDSEIDFVSWFMGSKQMSVESNTLDFYSVENTKSTKKQLLSSGITVNRILYKVLLKKMVNNEISIA